ncbi:MAG: hypothetical protein ACUVXB_07245 [Bryobacteraceae bacterium]
MPAILMPLCLLSAPPADRLTLGEVRLLWGRGEQNADPDLLYHRERWHCVLREVGPAGSNGGAVRVLSSADGRVWQSSALLLLLGEDLRHPSLCAAPDGRLLLSAEAHSTAIPGPPPRTFLWSSPDGRDWEGPVQPLEAGVLLGPVRWRLNRAYGLAFDTWGNEPLQLYSSADGLKYTLHASELVRSGTDARPPLLFFLRDGLAVAALSSAQTHLGDSRPPYRAWSWKPLEPGMKILALAELPDGRILAAAAGGHGTRGLALGWLDPSAAQWTPSLSLPWKGPENGTALVVQGGTLYVAYSSEHEGRRMLYWAEVLLPRGR